MSPYKQLKQIFHSHQNGEKLAKEQHELRLSFPSTVIWDFYVGEHPLFVVHTNEVVGAIEQVWSNELRLAPKWASLPDAAKSHYLSGLLIEEIRATNSIEGIRSTRQEIAEALKKPRTTAHKRFREMAALYSSLLFPRHETPIFPQSPREVRSLYDELLADEIADNNKPDGQVFRAHSVSIHDGQKKIHTAPTNEGDITARLDTFLAAQNSSSHRLVNALMGHFMFEYTHPFYDGNGRIGRFLLAFALIEALSAPTAMSVSHQFSLQRAKYYKAFEEAEAPLNRGEGTFFLLKMLAILTDAQEQLEMSLSEKLALLTSLQENAAKVELSENQVQILFILGQAKLFGPDAPVAARDMQNYLNRSWKTVRDHVTELQERGLVTTVKKRPLELTLAPKGLDLLGLN